MLLAGTAEMSVVGDETISYHGESSLSLLSKLLDSHLRRFLPTAHTCEKTDPSDVRFEPIRKPKLRTGQCASNTFPVTKMPPSYSFDAKALSHRSRTISSFAARISMN